MGTMCSLDLSQKNLLEQNYDAHCIFPEKLENEKNDFFQRNGFLHEKIFSRAFFEFPDFFQIRDFSYRRIEEMKKGDFQINWILQRKYFRGLF